MIRRLLALLLGLALLLFAPGAARASDSVRVVVGELDGDDSPSVRNALVRLLLAQSGVELVSRAYFEKVAARLGASPKDARGKQAVCRALGVAVVLEGEIDQAEDGVSLTLRVRGADGEVAETQELAAKTQRALVKQITESGWQKLGAAISDAEPAKTGAKQRLVLAELSGPKAAEVRAALEKALGKSPSLELVPEAEAAVARPEEAQKPADRVLVAASLGASALLSGEVKVAGRTELTLRVLNGKNGDDLGEVTLKGAGLPGLRRAIDADLVKKLAPILAEAARPTPPREEAEEETLEDEPAPKQPTLRPSPLEAMLALRGGTRNFRYSDDLFGALRAYKMGPTPAAFVAVRWYPAAHFEGGPIAHVGIAASFEQAFLIESQADGETYPTTAREWQLGLHGRLPLGALELGADLGLGEHAFNVDDDPNFPVVPDVAYRFVRLGVDARYRAGSFSVGGSFGYRHVSEAGTVETAAWFPRLQVAGLDAGAFAGYAVIPRLDVLAGALYRRYWYSMNPEPGDRFIAGGALDSYISGWIGVGYQLPAD
ncbi:MAG: hypothetical protein IPM35_34000 [Myxococcales bacterium]|nr:hypothetical protein [Myxococcales bacterium]